MHTPYHAFAIAALFSSLAFGQNAAEQSVDRVLYFAHVDNPQGIQHINNAIRALTDIPAVPDVTQHSLALHGTVSQVDLAEWLFHELDQSPNAQPQANPNSNSVRYDYRPPSGTSEIAGVFSFTNASSPLHIQETVNTIRAISEVVRLMPVDERAAIVLRGDPNRVALAEWLFHELDQPANAQPGAPLPLSPQEYRLPPGVDRSHNDVARVFYLAHAPTAQDLQRIISTVRATTKITRLMPMSEPKAMVLRATDEQVAEAEQLIKQLDSPSTPAAKQ
jgi:hypothetical protein